VKQKNKNTNDRLDNVSNVLRGSNLSGFDNNYKIERYDDKKDVFHMKSKRKYSISNKGLIGKY